MESKSAVISVQASAGSGKTYSLAKRYIALLLDFDSSQKDVPLKNIIAVTFANKAAIEMKRRVLEYLKRSVFSLDTEGVFSGSGKDISSKSLTALNKILDNYDSFNISTIDSFINSILKACAINVDISPNFRIEQDYSKNLNFALDSFLKNASSSSALEKLLLEYVSQYIMSEKSGWFPKNDIYNEVEKVFKKAGNTGKEISASGVSLKDGIFSAAAAAEEKIKLFASSVRDLSGVYSNYAKAVDKALSEGRKLFYSPETIPKAFASDNLKYKKNAEIDSKADELWSLICAAVKKICELYSENYYAVYSDIYSKIDSEFDIQSRKDDLVFLHDINKKALTLFESSGAVMPEVYYRLSEKYKHFLVDEFQDTSPIQWTGIKRFLEESLAGGGSFFYVGDAKQAIYDFRGGNWEIFYRAAGELAAFGEETVLLSSNFRSHREIVEFNNEVFSAENIERYLKEISAEDEDIKKEYADLLSVYSDSKQSFRRDKNKGYVEIEALADDAADQEEEVRKTFTGYIRRILTRFDPENVAVLCRSNAEVLKAGSWLLEEGYSVESNQTLNMKNSPLIKELVSLLMFIDSPMDSLSFCSFITGEIFFKSSFVPPSEIRDLYSISAKNTKQTFFIKDLRKGTGICGKSILKNSSFSPVLSPFTNFCFPFLRNSR